MANYTNHYNLVKPLQSEHYDVDVANQNNDIIDEELHKKVDNISGKGLSTNDFTDFYKRKVDSYSMPFNFRGNVATYNDLPSTSTNGYVYGVLDENKTYVWNSELGEWVDMGNIINTSVLITKEEFDARVLDYEVVDEW